MIKLIAEHKNCECSDMLKKTDVCMPEKCHIIHEDTLDLFDYYKKKSEKLGPNQSCGKLKNSDSRLKKSCKT